MSFFDYDKDPTGTANTAANTAEALAGTEASKYMSPAATKAVVDRVLAAIMGADYLQSDGATTGRRIETQYGTVGAVAGSDLTIVCEPFDVPTSNVSATAYLWGFSPSNTGEPGAEAHSLSFHLLTNGTLRIRQTGATPGSDYRLFDYVGWRAAFSGRRVRPIAAFTGNSTTAPTVFQDGVDISSSFAVSTSGSAPNWVSSSLATTYFIQGWAWPSGYFRPGRPVNRKYAQADVDFVQLTGRLPYADAAGGTMAESTDLNSNTSFETDTASPPSQWAHFGNHVATAVADGTAPGGANVAEIVASGAGSVSGNNLATTTTVLTRNRRWKISFYAKSISGSADLRVVVPQNTADVTYNQAITTSWVKYEIEHSAAGDVPNGVRFFLAAAGTVRLDLIRYRAIGALSDPIIQPCLVLDDATQNNRGSLLVGFTPVTDRKDWRIPARVDMTTTGNKQLFGGNVFERQSVHAFDTVEVTTAGTPTFRLNDAVAANYTASTAYTAGRTRTAVNSPMQTTSLALYADVTVAHASSSSELIIVRGHRE